MIKRVRRYLASSRIALFVARTRRIIAKFPFCGLCRYEVQSFQNERKTHSFSLSAVIFVRHNSGQTRPVCIKRLVIADTFEERILKARRSLAADCPHAGPERVSSQRSSGSYKVLRGVAAMEMRKNIAERRFEKLAMLENAIRLLFGGDEGVVDGNSILAVKEFDVVLT